MVIAILSDAHVPEQAEEVPPAFRSTVAEADHVVHAGDFGSTRSYRSTRERADQLTAVYGNADPLDIDLPAVASVTVEGVTVVVTHGIVNRVERAVSSSEGVVFDRDDWLRAVADVTRARAEPPMVGVAGHSHRVEDEVHDGVRVLNPGSVTGVGPADGATMMTAEVDGDGLEVTVHEA